jgi:hypothetical protein
MLPVRKIGRGYGSLRAAHPSEKMGRIIQLESALERDFCCILEFEYSISSFVEQPVTIEYELDGVKKRYTPDFLVKYIDDQSPVLVEIKYRVDIRKNWAELKPKFRAAKEYAATQGWKFLIYTDKEIQNPYLKNIKFLLRFRKPLPPACTQYYLLLLEALNILNEATLEKLVEAVISDVSRQVTLLPVLWHLISQEMIGCDLSQPLTMQSLVWTVDESFSLPGYDKN